MATFYAKENGPGSPEALSNQGAMKQIDQLVTGSTARNLVGSPYADFTGGKMSLEDVLSKYGAQVKANPFDPTKGPQIDYGQGAQPLSGAQAGALAQGKSIQDVAQIGAPINQAQQAYNAQVAQQNQTTQNLARQKQFDQAFQQVKGKAAPATAGEATGAMKGLIPPPATQQPSPIEQAQQTAQASTTPNVDNFFNNLQTNPNPVLAQTTTDLQNYLSPPGVQADLMTQMQKLMGDQNTLVAEKAQLMNVQNIMSGTSEDIRNEVQAANGFATNSQVLALATARNQTLLKQATLIQNQIQAQQDAVQNDTTLLNFEKDLANTQFSQRMQMAQLVQKNQVDMRNAARDSAKTLVSALGYDGMYAAVKNDPAQLASTADHYGMTVQEFQQAASQAATARAQATQKATLENQKLVSDIQQNALATQETNAANADVPATIGQITNPNESRSELGGLSVNGLIQKAQAYLTNGGNIQGLGLSGKGNVAAQRTLIANYAGYLADKAGMTVPQITAAYKANSKAATEVTSRIAKIDTTSATLTQQFPRLAQLAANVGNLGITEADLTAGKAAALRKFGSPDAANYIELLQTLRGDYSAMQAAIGGSRGGEFFARSAQDAIPLGLTPQQYLGIGQTIQASAAIAQKAAGDEVGKLIGSSGTSGGALEGQTQTYQGATYKVVNGQWVKQ